MSGIDAQDEQLMVNKLRDYLPQKSYVVVFDDVWKTEFWDSIKNSLPDNHIGGRIIITTHNRLIVRLLIIVKNLHMFVFTSCNHYLGTRHGSSFAKGLSNLILKDIVPQF